MSVVGRRGVPVRARAFSGWLVSLLLAALTLASFAPPAACGVGGSCLASAPESHACCGTAGESRPACDPGSPGLDGRCTCQARETSEPAASLVAPGDSHSSWAPAESASTVDSPRQAGVRAPLASESSGSAHPWHVPLFLASAAFLI